MMNPVTEYIKPKLESLGLGEIKVISEVYDPERFGNADLKFLLGALIIHILKDRGQYIVEIGSANHPDKFYFHDYVFVAMEWESMDAALNRKELMPLDDVLVRIKNKFDDLDTAFSKENEIETISKFESTERNIKKELLKQLM